MDRGIGRSNSNVSQVCAFLLIDIENSTALLSRYPEAMADSMRRFETLLAEKVPEHGGSLFKATGDGGYAAFESAIAAAECAVETQLALVSEIWPQDAELRARIGIHVGEAEQIATDYRGLAVHRAARVMDAGHGGQIVVSETTEALISTGLPKRMSLKPLGSFHLRGFEEPEKLYQLCHPNLAADFPPLRAPAASQGNLTENLSAFIGRHEETQKLISLLQSARLVSIVGPGGAGKSRLAAHVAALAAAQYDRGAWLVDCSETKDEEGIWRAMLSALKVPRRADQSVEEAIVDALKEGHWLVVLDGLESAGASARALVEKTLAQCKAVIILAASRHRLDLPYEKTLAISGLTLSEGASPEKVIESHACRLFAERAELDWRDVLASSLDLSAIANICRRVDGLPLAIELAASWAGSLTPSEIERRLDRIVWSAPGGLTETIRTSYELLTDTEKRLFARCSVFVNGFDIESAETVCSEPPLTRDSILPLIDSLVAKSMLCREAFGDQSRYRMLSALREFGQLEAKEEAEKLRLDHADRYLSLAQELEGRLSATGDSASYRRFGVEHENLLTALRTLSQQESPDVLTLAVAVLPFWYSVGRVEEAKEWLSRGLEIGSEDRLDLKARSLNALGLFATEERKIDDARQLLEEALDIRRAIGDRAGEAATLNNLGRTLKEMNRHSTAYDRYREAQAIFRTLGDNVKFAIATINVYGAANDAYVSDLPLDDLETAVQTLRGTGEAYLWYLGAALHNYGEALLDRGNVGGALNAVRESLEIRGRVGDRLYMALTLTLLIRLLIELGDPQNAVRVLGAVDRLVDLGARNAGLLDTERRRESVAHLKSLYGEARFSELKQEGASLTWEELVELSRRLAD
ncbi:MAG: tetratricopeptide repeat protein [Armatimonadetes bacterium]|nr:tetratricopeptide repeat protein [Armatimonadota bacterium]